MTLEKGLKALVAKRTEAIPPKIHDLEILAEKAELVLPGNIREFFSLMNTFNLEASYPDERFEIYKKTTKKYTEDLLNETVETLNWIKNN